jgi:hypothetical protein
MNLFFDHIDTLNQITRNLAAYLNYFICRSCALQDQFVSHGFIYKKLTGGDRIPIGKRLLCSPRNGRSGCGATLQLYLSSHHHRLHHDTLRIQLFILALLADASISEAYHKATGTRNARNAYRWRQKCLSSLPRWRERLPDHTGHDCAPFSHRCRWLRLVLPTLSMLQQSIGDVSAFQLHCQHSFLG